MFHESSIEEKKARQTRDPIYTPYNLIFCTDCLFLAPADLQPLHDPLNGDWNTAAQWS